MTVSIALGHEFHKLTHLPPPKGVIECVYCDDCHVVLQVLEAPVEYIALTLTLDADPELARRLREVA